MLASARGYTETAGKRHALADPRCRPANDSIDGPTVRLAAITAAKAADDVVAG